MSFTGKLIILTLFARLPGGAAVHAAEFEVLDKFSVDGYSEFRGSAAVSSGLFTVGASTLVVKNGNVGIGTTGPSVLLQLQSSTDSGVSASTNLLKLTRPNNNAVSYPQAVDFAVGRYSTNTNAPYTQLDIKLKSASANDFATDATVMTVLSSGNVGIGTTSPGAKLDVAGNLRIPGGNYIFLSAGTSPNPYLNYGAAANRIKTCS